MVGDSPDHGPSAAGDAEQHAFHQEPRDTQSQQPVAGTYESDWGAGFGPEEAQCFQRRWTKEQPT